MANAIKAAVANATTDLGFLRLEEKSFAAAPQKVRLTLQTTRDDDIFAIGDCAECPWPGHARPVPPRLP